MLWKKVRISIIRKRVPELRWSRSGRKKILRRSSSFFQDTRETTFYVITSYSIHYTKLYDMQLCYARRFFKGYDQPNIGQCNFDSVVFAAESYMSENPGSMALITDLTSFVQVGDIVITSYSIHYTKLYESHLDSE